MHLFTLLSFVSVCFQATDAFVVWSGPKCHFLATQLASSTSDNVSGTKMTPKQVLFAFLQTQFALTTDRLPCGLDGTNKSDMEVILKLVETLEQDEMSNFLLQTFNGKITGTQVLGEWQLLYTSSRTMRINKSLSGLGRSSSDSANFSALQLSLSGSEFLGVMEFIELIGGSDSVLEVKINGEWMLQPERNPFTGAPTTALRLDPEKIAYGGVNKADAKDWNSLGPIKLLDILYLDEDLLITRGNVNTESIFIFERI